MIIAAGIAEGAHDPADIPSLVDDRAPPADAVKALKAAKPHLFKTPNAVEMTREEYQAAKAKALRAIRRAG